MTEDKWRNGTSPKPLLEFLFRNMAAQTMDVFPQRKLRLFACACVRRLTLVCNDERLWEVVNTVEQAADGTNLRKSLEACSEQLAAVDPPDWANDDACWRSCRDGVLALTLPEAKSAAKLATEKAKIASGCYAWLSAQPERQPKIHVGDASDPKIKPLAAALNIAWSIERDAQARLLRDIFGFLPFRPVTINLSWLTQTVANLASVAYEERSLPSGALDPSRLGVLADALEDAGCADQSILDHLRGPGPHVRGCFALDLVLVTSAGLRT